MILLPFFAVPESLRAPDWQGFFTAETHAFLAAVADVGDLLARESDGTDVGLAALAFRLYCWEYRTACEPEWHPSVSREDFGLLPLQGPHSVESVTGAEPGQIETIYRDNFVNAVRILVDQLNGERYGAEIPGGARTGEVIIAGHGDKAGSVTTVPDGVYVYMYAADGFTMTVRRALDVIEGDRSYRQVYGPGSRIPNYQLSRLESDIAGAYESVRRDDLVYVSGTTSLCSLTDTPTCPHRECEGIFAREGSGYTYLHLLICRGPEPDPTHEDHALKKAVDRFLSLPHAERKSFWAAASPRLRHKFHGYSTAVKVWVSVLAVSEYAASRDSEFTVAQSIWAMEPGGGYLPWMREVARTDGPTGIVLDEFDTQFKEIASLAYEARAHDALFQRRWRGLSDDSREDFLAVCRDYDAKAYAKISRRYTGAADLPFDGESGEARRRAEELLAGLSHGGGKKG